MKKYGIYILYELPLTISEGLFAIVLHVVDRKWLFIFISAVWCTLKRLYGFVVTLTNTHTTIYK